ncbi:lipopolysaccharide biosynthesis protein [Granulicella sp. WH15]|uniref:GumC family protein n=1 Tax=Granulicella sp. WH15 TaxID=2602070 RepID=UPI001366D669|nr:Wzz/FepE/Etk N-terminal domain-containing protein [Granulicella sp. WH15]QHN04317.1 lipopolysaccharide biosynthesis protein [Granulicella sp. WH15]
MIDQATHVAPLTRENRSNEDRLQPSVDQASQVNILDLLDALKQGRKTILLIAAGIFLASVVTAFSLPAKYSSVAAFVPPTNSSSSSASALAGQLSALGPASLLAGVKTSGDLYAGILKSRSIAEKLIRRFNLKQIYRVKHDSDAIKRLASNTNIEVGVKDTIIRITVQDKSPERARDLVNAYLDALRETNGRLALTESSQRRMFFDNQLAKEKNDLADAEVELKKSQEQYGLISPTGQTALQLETIAKTRAQIAAHQIELADLQQSSTPQNPMVMRLQSVIAGLEEQLARLQNGGANNDAGNIPMAKVPAAQLAYIRQAREVKYHEALFEMIAKQDEAARMDEAHDAPLLQILDFASYPDQRSGPPRALISLGGLLLGTLMGSLWVLVRKRVLSTRSTFAPMKDLSSTDAVQ